MLLAWRESRHAMSGYEADERSSMGECGCALPAADEAQAHEWQPSQSASELASVARCGNGNRASKRKAFVRKARRGFVMKARLALRRRATMFSEGQ